MYDLVNWTFKTNAGTGTFTAGNVYSTLNPSNPQPIISNNWELKASANLFDQSLFNTDVGITVTYYTFSIDNGTYTMSTNMPYASGSLANVFLFAGQVTSGASTGTNGVTMNTPRTITVTNGKYTVAYRSRVSAGDTAYNPKDYNWMLARSSSAQSYQPYVEGGLYTEGITETITDSANNTATAEMLLSMGDYTDTQEILTGAVTRKVWVIILDGTEDWGLYATNNGYRSYRVNNFLSAYTRKGICTHLPYYDFSSANMDRECVAIGGNKITFYINLAGENRTVDDMKAWLASQYAAWTPVMFIYPLATETTETVTGQTLTTIQWDNTLTITQWSIDNLPIEANYDKIWGLTISFVNDSWFITESDLSGYQTVENMVTTLSWADNTHYPTAKAVSDAIQSAGGGDMMKSTYDPNNVEANAFDYDNFINTPTIPSKTSDLNNDSWFITWINSTDVTSALWYTPVNPSTLWTAATKDTWTSSWNVPVLDSNWHLANSTIPWVALTDTFTVSTSSDLTTLSSADQWDLAIVTSENKTYVLSQAPYSTAANWKQILTPTEWVTSVNGQTWAVTLSIPTDTLDLTNWAGYITSSDIPTDYVKTSWNQTIAWTKTFSTSPVVPSKTTAATNSWTKIATEAQVYKKQDTISDLATIRSWAAAWATALQPWDVPWNIFLTQSAYDALPSSKTSDWNTYLIIS